MSENNQTIEQKIVTLEKMVAWFNSDEFVLEDALDMYAKAEKLAATITEDISALKNKVELVAKNE